MDENWRLFVLMLGICALSIPFIAFNMSLMRLAGPNVRAPFTFYEGITAGLNLGVGGVYSYWCNFPEMGYLLLGISAFMVTYVRLRLTRWYRENPGYTQRLFG
jgi:hypothetical protein